MLPKTASVHVIRSCYHDHNVKGFWKCILCLYTFEGRMARRNWIGCMGYISVPSSSVQMG